MLKKIDFFFKKTITKMRWQELLAILIFFLAFVFFQSERKEMSSILPQLHATKTLWITAGILLTVVCVLLQAFMYMSSFLAVGVPLKFADALELFLKRNFLSVFLPAGGISSLAFTPRQIQRKNYDKKTVHKSSTIYGFVGIVTVFLVGIPVVAYAAFVNKNFGNSWIWLVGVGLFIGLVLWMVNSLRKKGLFYDFIKQHFPKQITNINKFFGGEIHKKYFYLTIFISILIEFCGIFHLLIAMLAFGVNGSFSAAAVGYTISVLLMLVSPFLRGLGAVEFTLIYILANFGFSHSQVLGITLLYRVFEFWLPLLLGLFALVWHGSKIIARIVPALAIFILGLINIISVITPPLAGRITTTIKENDEERSYGEKLSDRVAQFGGSWRFIIIFGLILMIWILYNTQVMHNKSFDPYPYILLNLILSCIAAIQAPIIMMSQNRKEVKDRKRSINDYMINLKSEIEIRNLHEKVDLSIIDQYKHLCDIQQKQLELLEELNKKVRLLSKPSNLS